MRIPASLKVGGKEYVVLQGHHFTERSDLAGLTCHSTLMIRLSGTATGGEPMAQENVEQTFIHELLHCVDAIFNANALEEDAVTRLGEGLYQALKDNGMFADEPVVEAIWEPPA